MDPLSFAASLITVVSFVTASSKKIRDLRGKLQNAPKDVENLLEQVQTFESLLVELNTQLQDHRNNVTPQETLQQVWGSSLAQMQRDVQSLQSVLSKVESLVKKKSKSSKLLLLARQLFSEKEVEQYRKKIDTHCGTLTNIQAVVCNRKLETVSHSISNLGNEDRAGFQTISSQLSQAASQLGSDTKAGFSTVSSQNAVTESANQERHLTVLAHLDHHSKRDDLTSKKLDKVSQQQVESLYLNEAGFQAVHHSLVAASASSSEDHKTTRAMLSQCQGQLQQVLRNHVSFGTVENSVRLSTPRARALNTITEATVFWKYSSYRMPIGLLEISLSENRQSKGSARSTLQVCTESDIAIQFVPPRWLSGVALNYSLKLSYDLIGDQWRWGATLNPLTVNYNPFFIDAVNSLDVEGVRRSFAEGLAKPTDYMLDWESRPQPWYTFLVEGQTRSPTQYESMFCYMVENGLPGQERIIIQIACEDSEELLLKCVHSFLEHGGRIFEAGSKVFTSIFGYTAVGHIDWIPDFVFRASEPGLLDEMSSLQICYIGTLAHVDAVFCDRLKKELASCYSPPSLHRTRSADHLFETIFRRASIENRFRALTSYETLEFLAILCRTGSVAMIEPFIDLGVDVNGGDYYENMLGSAAAAGNVDVVNMLLGAGANGSLAIEIFLFESSNLPDALFRSLLESLVENARPASFTFDKDPLLALIESSRALCSYPMAPKILLDRNVFTNEYLGEPASKKGYYSCSYMYLAISRGHPSVVDLLLRNGARADGRISQSFYCEGKYFESCTWLTLAVVHGEASCTDVLIQHGADVTALDGAGKSAIQLARQNAIAPHPRFVGCVYTRRKLYMERVGAEQDAETLLVVERAFNLKFQGAMSIEDYLNSNKVIAPRPPSPREKSTPMLQKIFETALGIFLTPTQKERLLNYLKPLYRDTRKIWSLPFHEALLMRSIYVLSYTILFAYELHAFLKGRKRIPMPSRFLLSALALLALAVIWVSSSEGGFGWGLFGIAGKEPKMESGN